MDRADGAAHALEEAFAADVLVGGGRLRFTHPLLAEWSPSGPPLEWREVHRHLAELVENPEERCRHLAAAASGPDARVASMLEVAAEEARGRGALVATAELAELAVELTPERMPPSAGGERSSRRMRTTDPETGGAPARCSRIW